MTALAILDPPTANALTVTGLRVRFGGLVAVDVERMEIGQGLIVGLVGPNGAGKTTLFDAISGFVRVESGRVELGGRRLDGRPVHARASLGVWRSFQNANLFESLTVHETLLVAHEQQLRGLGAFAGALHLPGAARRERAARVEADELVTLMGLGAYRDKFLNELSTGTRRIVDLAAVLIAQPTVLLLDEPSSGIAQREVEELGSLLRDVRDALQCTLVVVEHDIPLIRGLADEMYAMETGRIIARGTPEQVLTHPRVIESYLGVGTRAVERSGTAREGGPVRAISGKVEQTDQQEVE